MGAEAHRLKGEGVEDDERLMMLGVHDAVAL